MFVRKVNGKRTVTLPDGRVLSRADLPPADTQRWTAARKMTVVRGVLYGLIGRDEALERYGLSEAEFTEWIRAAERHGVAGLKATVRHGQVDNQK